MRAGFLVADPTIVDLLAVLVLVVLVGNLGRHLHLARSAYVDDAIVAAAWPWLGLPRTC